MRAFTNSLLATTHNGFLFSGSPSVAPPPWKQKTRSTESRTSLLQAPERAISSLSSRLLCDKVTRHKQSPKTKNHATPATSCTLDAPDFISNFWPHGLGENVVETLKAHLHTSENSAVTPKSDDIRITPVYPLHLYAHVSASGSTFISMRRFPTTSYQTPTGSL